PGKFICARGPAAAAYTDTRANPLIRVFGRRAAKPLESDAFVSTCGATGSVRGSALRGPMLKTTTMIKRLACASLLAVLAACGSAPVASGFYRVERGDTLSKVARSHRQSVQN